MSKQEGVWKGQPQSLGGGQYAPAPGGPPVYYPPQVTYAGGPPPPPNPYSQPMQPMDQQQQPQYYVQAMPQQQYVPLEPMPTRVQGGAACKKCGQVYPLPPGAGSWRCKNCSEFNNMGGDQCTVM